MHRKLLAIKNSKRLRSGKVAHQTGAEEILPERTAKSFKQDTAVENKSIIYNLNPVIDVKGLIRAGERLRRAFHLNISPHQIILPKEPHLTGLIIRLTHKEVVHFGTNCILNAVKSKH